MSIVIGHIAFDPVTWLCVYQVLAEEASIADGVSAKVQIPNCHCISVNVGLA